MPQTVYTALRVHVHQVRSHRDQSQKQLFENETEVRRRLAQRQDQLLVSQAGVHRDLNEKEARHG